MILHRFLFIAAVGLTACGTPGSDEGGGSPAEAVVSVRTAVVTAQPFTETVEAIGAVVTRPGHVAALAAPAPTRVTAIYVTLGQRVRRGDSLVRLEQPTFDAAHQSSLAALENARRSYERAKRLADEGILPRKEVDQAEAALAQATATEVASRREQELATLRAPLPGVITEMNAVLGATADVAQTLVEVTDPSALDVMLELAPAAASRVRPGQPVTLIAGLRPEGDSLGTGPVVDVGAEVDSTTRTVAVRVRIAHPARLLRVGETVLGRIVVRTEANALSVPADALVPEGEGYQVFVVDSAGVAHARKVTIGARAEASVEILHGLRAGETVVTYGAFGVADSARVEPVKS
jgi:RND family efflux transporter MFP subunit